jgi:hypothetical protein
MQRWNETWEFEKLGSWKELSNSERMWMHIVSKTIKGLEIFFEKLFKFKNDQNFIENEKLKFNCWLTFSWWNWTQTSIKIVQIYSRFHQNQQKIEWKDFIFLIWKWQLLYIGRDFRMHDSWKSQSILKFKFQ